MLATAFLDEWLPPNWQQLADRIRLIVFPDFLIFDDTTDLFSKIGVSTEPEPETETEPGRFAYRAYWQSIRSRFRSRS